MSSDDDRFEEARKKWDRLDRKRAFYLEAMKRWPEGSPPHNDAKAKVDEVEKEIDGVFKDLDG
jgi:hypothetical protein